MLLCLECSSSFSNAFPTFVLKDKYVFSSNFFTGKRREEGTKKGERINFLKGKKKQRKKALRQTFLHMIKVRVNYKSFIHIIASTWENYY